MTRSGRVDITALLTDEHRAFMAGLPARTALFRGFTMKEDGDDDGDGDGDGDDEHDEADPDSVVTIDGKTFKVSDLQGIMAREKRQGKRAGQKALLTALGVDSVEELKEALAEAGKPAKKKAASADDDDADKGPSEAEKRAEKREREAAAKERRSDLVTALAAEGVSKADMDDALAILDRQVPSTYDDDDIEEQIEKMLTRRPALFGADEADDTEDKPKPRKRAAVIPPGNQRGKKKATSKPFGQGGIERAKRRGWVKDPA